MENKENILTTYLKELNNWEVSPDKKSISRLFQFQKIEETLDCITHIAYSSREMNHFPEIKIFDDFKAIKVEIKAKKELREKDFILAKNIERIARYKVKLEQFLTSRKVIFILLILLLLELLVEYLKK